MKLQPKSLSHALFPIMVLNWLAGLAVIEYPFGKPRIMLSFFYVILNISVYCYAYYYDPISQIPEANKITKTILKILKCGNFFVATCSTLIGWYYYKEFKIMIQRMELLEETLKSLGLPNNYGRVIKNTLLKTVMWLVTVSYIMLSDILLLGQLLDLAKCLHLLYLFQYPIHLSSLVDLTFTSIVNCIGLTFENINLLLKRRFLIDSNPKSFKETYQNHCRINALVVSIEHSDILNNGERQKKMLILIRHLHMELTKISSEVNQIYQVQISMVIVSCLITMTCCFYLLFTTILFANEVSLDAYRRMYNILGWCTLYVYRFLNINFTCAFASSKSRKTKDILYRMKTISQDPELKTEVEQFSLELTLRPLVISVCAFTLGYSFVEKVIRTATTYLVILINMTLQKSKIK